MVVNDVLLQRTFPLVLPTGPTARPRMPDWWPTQTNRQGGGPLGPHVIERGGGHINQRGRSLADEALRRVAVEITSQEQTQLIV